jgi:hypothetical protein
MRQSGQIMHKTVHGLRSSYKAGCRCDLCKQAEAAYKRDLRRRQREDVGLYVTPAVPSLSLVTGGGAACPDLKSEHLTSENAANTGGAVESAVALEIEGLGAHHRPGLAAGALAMGRLLDNPKAVSTWPAAAAKLAHILDMLRRNSAGTKPKLASVREMTKPKLT